MKLEFKSTEVGDIKSELKMLYQALELKIDRNILDKVMDRLDETASFSTMV